MILKSTRIIRIGSALRQLENSFLQPKIYFTFVDPVFIAFLDKLDKLYILGEKTLNLLQGCWSDQNDENNYQIMKKSLISSNLLICTMLFKLHSLTNKIIAWWISSLGILKALQKYP